MTRSANVSLGLAVGTAVIAGGLLAVQHRADLPASGDLALALALLAAAAITLKFCVDWWRFVDEAAREAHKFAWYWGGSLGLGAAGGLAMVFQREPQHLPQAFDFFTGDAGLFAAGVLACIACQMVGYLIAWAGWWLVRR